MNNNPSFPLSKTTELNAYMENDHSRQVIILRLFVQYSISCFYERGYLIYIQSVKINLQHSTVGVESQRVADLDSQKYT